MLYPRAPPPGAAPKCISGRTSYLRVRLAFHPYPQLIRAFCNRHRFGPPPPLTAASAWSWVAHPVSGLPGATRRPLRTRVRCGSGCRRLSLAAPGLSPVRSTKSTPSPARGSDGPRARGFRFSFTPLAGVLFTVPSRYSALSVLQGIQPWDVVAPASHGISRAPRYSRAGAEPSRFHLRDSHPLRSPVPAAFG